MHPNPRRILPVLGILILLGLAGYYLVWPAISKDGALVVSGTVEATEVRLASELGGVVDEVYVAEGDLVAANQNVVSVQPSNSTRGSSRERIRTPIAGTVLYRSVEPGEFASPGAPLVTVADLDRLTLTVYVPEDRYGQIMLGASYPVTVDSYPAEVFTGTVSHIADRAEFTPRNVQTTDSRKTTVFAIKLDLAQNGGKLKPGMPADVNLGE
ncbi:MAG: efflux RND transporter periplasmic adaptor subunit [Caldilineaceae bacterium]|nr:efflux RND transporter periplasmic adaptor subunit [Caldilineaceae bacterium]MCB9118957.1 efflux RND transporter periplasmic adaptor subunit [Caldilineaceae bacterium]MCB9125669.1 efflux RND transporter periplasmic adaptor subunit [Caldilineaceae bacterium]